VSPEKLENAHSCLTFLKAIGKTRVIRSEEELLSYELILEGVRLELATNLQNAGVIIRSGIQVSEILFFTTKAKEHYL
jgi:hypothetical protein